MTYIAIINGIFVLVLYRIVGKRLNLKFSLDFEKIRIPKRYIKEGLVFSLIGIGGLLTLKMDIAMLSWMATPEEVGVYGLAEKIVSKVASFRGIMLTAFFPVFIKRFNANPVKLSLITQQMEASGLPFG